MKIARTSFFLFVALYGGLAFAEVKIDSMVVHLDSMSFSSHSSYSGNSSSQSGIMNLRFKFAVDSGRTSGDSLFFYGKDRDVMPQDQMDTAPWLVIVWDTLHSAIVSLNYNPVEYLPYPDHHSRFLKVDNVSYVHSANMYVIDLSNVTSSSFEYDLANWHYTGHTFDGQETTGSETFGGTNTITLYIRSGQSRAKEDARSMKKFSCNPNPASSYVDLAFDPRSVSEIVLYDVLGRQIHTFHVLTESVPARLDVSAYPPGIYWLRAGAGMQKFVIAR